LEWNTYYCADFKTEFGGEIIRQGAVSELVIAKQCPFCKLVLHLMAATDTDSTLHWEKRARSQDCEYWFRIWAYRYSYHRATHFQVEVFDPEAGTEDKNHVIGIIHIQDLNFRMQNGFLNSTILGKTQASSLQILSWLKACNDKHDLCRERYAEARRSRPIEIRLIDVLKQRLVRATSSSRYCILSYVWGGVAMLRATRDNISHLEKVDSLSTHQLPRTIQDAMILVASLGVRYLWVDALCIVQDDPNEKHCQINQMNIIYSQAWLTLVALSAIDANSELPGVCPGSRSAPRARRRVHGKTLVSEPSAEPSDLFRSSVYEQRAWTFQEKILSLRCLYICTKQVQFECSTMFEEKVSPLSHPYRNEPGCGHGNSLARLWTKPQNWPIKFDAPTGYRWIFMSIYGELVADYTGRELSYQSDILDAFSGILSLLQQRHSGPFSYALPESVFDLALLWTHQRNSSRRLASNPDQPHEHRFPSWSWAGWHGLAQYAWRSEPFYRLVDGEHLQQILSEISSFQIHNGDGFKEIRRRPGEGYYVSGITEHQLTPLRTLPSQHPADAPTPTILHFCASTVDASQFTIKRELTLLESATNWNLEYFLVDRLDEYCGMLYYDSNLETLWGSKRQLAFILLSRLAFLKGSDWNYRRKVHQRACKFDHVQYRLLRETPWPVLNVMLIEWKESIQPLPQAPLSLNRGNSVKTAAQNEASGKQGTTSTNFHEPERMPSSYRYAERIAIGQISARAWNLASPEEKYIRLA
jgi:hypothetical protein